MSHSSPASYLVWSLLTFLLGVFLVFHLWSFDRFKCLRWDSGAGSGAFKRVMTYSYLITIPMILTYAAGNAAIKYHEGFIAHPTLGIIPKPYQLWEKSAQDTIFPLMLLFSVGWGLEMVTHLEELCFWLFLVNSGSSQQSWFKSFYFRTWIVGSSLAVAYMPIVTCVTKSKLDPLKSEAFTFLAGSLGSLSLTLWFTPILWTFPAFLRNLKDEGVDTATIVRLTKFSELNTIRVVFRFLFTVPLLILGVDGVRPHNHINESMLWTDFLIMVAGFGCVISSGITLVLTLSSQIFFPRSIEGEIAARDEAKERKRMRSLGHSTSMADSIHRQNSSHRASTVGGTYLLTSSPVKQNFDLHSFDGHDAASLNGTTHRLDRTHFENDESKDVAAALPSLKPNRKKGQDIEMSRIESLTESNLSVHNLRGNNINPMISNFKSPIDFSHAEGQNVNSSRLTFNRR
ncbi:hypothetical protein D9619_001609 [Psilocybe cf. subviscida]|uniref:Uncharacterized protein n=1 Tax=Psilocybe cf. subviscida TaxID=2480587 RepID=A0A8H5BCR5_9AGAR|nr:hypothetical protein D9619_001609 [Psilocybe cf. subviscida]